MCLSEYVLLEVLTDMNFIRLDLNNMFLISLFYKSWLEDKFSKDLRFEQFTRLVRVFEYRFLLVWAFVNYDNFVGLFFFCENL